MRTCPECKAEYAGAERFCPLDGTRLVERAVTPSDPYLGTTLQNRYCIRQLLGQGPTGRVYRAEHSLLGTTYAVKVIRAEAAGSPDGITAFRKAAARAGSLGGDPFVKVHDFGPLEDGSHYLVADYVEGESLAALLRREGRLDPLRAMGIVIQVGEALELAHAQGILHLALKPSNVFLVHRGAPAPFVKVLDFGIGELTRSMVPLSRRLATGFLPVDPAYVAPEQALGEPVDARTDVFGLGLLLYECLTGRPAFGGGDAAILLRRVIHEGPPSLPAGAGGPLPPEMNELFLRLTARTPDARYDGIAEAVVAMKLAAEILVAPAGESRDAARDTLLDLPRLTLPVRRSADVETGAGAAGALESAAAAASEAKGAPGGSTEPATPGTVAPVPEVARPPAAAAGKGGYRDLLRKADERAARIEAQTQVFLKRAQKADRPQTRGTEPGPPPDTVATVTLPRSEVERPEATEAVRREEVRPPPTAEAAVRPSFPPGAASLEEGGGGLDDGWGRVEREVLAGRMEERPRHVWEMPSLRTPVPGGPPGPEGGDRPQATEQPEVAFEPLAPPAPRPDDGLSDTGEAGGTPLPLTVPEEGRAAGPGGERGEEPLPARSPSAPPEVASAPAGPEADDAGFHPATPAVAPHPAETGGLVVPADGGAEGRRGRRGRGRKGRSRARARDQEALRTGTGVTSEHPPVQPDEGVPSSEVEATDGGSAGIEEEEGGERRVEDSLQASGEHEAWFDEGQKSIVDESYEESSFRRHFSAYVSAAIVLALAGGVVAIVMLSGKGVERGEPPPSGGSATASSPVPPAPVPVPPAPVPVPPVAPLPSAMGEASVVPAPSAGTLPPAASSPEPVARQGAGRSVVPPSPVPPEGAHRPPPGPAAPPARPPARPSPPGAGVSRGPAPAPGPGGPAAPPGVRLESPEARRQRANNLVSVGRSHLQNHLLAEASRAFDEAVRLDGQNAAAVAGLGEVAFQERRFADAVRYQRLAIRLAPNNSTYHNQLGASYFRLRDYRQAAEHWSRALELDPTNSDARAYLKMVQSKLDQEASK